MADGFFAPLRAGAFRMPDSLINSGGPLPSIPPNAVQFLTPDGIYNGGGYLPGGLDKPYAYGIGARISTQTQVAHPNRVALIIPKLYIPAPESDGQSFSDPVLQHSISDGDLVFTFRLGPNMSGFGPKWCEAPYGFANKAVALINLATVNYILWGLQVGMRSPKASRWRTFFNYLTQLTWRPSSEQLTEDFVWNFIKTYLRPFGIQHGGDQQGGMHEGDENRVVTHGAVDYVSSFAIEGKLRHVNNLWRDYDVRENDDVILALRYKAAPQTDLSFILSSSVRATRNERVSVTHGFYYLCPEVLQFRSFSDLPYIHVGRSMTYCSAYTRGLDACCWNARMPVTPGAPLHMTFEPGFVDSDRMYYKRMEIEDNLIMTGPTGDGMDISHERESEFMEQQASETQRKKKEEEESQRRLEEERKREENGKKSRHVLPVSANMRKVSSASASSAQPSAPSSSSKRARTSSSSLPASMSDAAATVAMTPPPPAAALSMLSGTNGSASASVVANSTLSTTTTTTTSAHSPATSTAAPIIPQAGTALVEKSASGSAV